MPWVSAEYLPWCNKIDESNKLIAELRDRIEQLRASDKEDEPVEAEAETAEPEQPQAVEAPAEEAPAEPEAPAEEKPEEDAGIEIHIEPNNDDAE